jgi:hypothetical protein
MSRFQPKGCGATRTGGDILHCRRRSEPGFRHGDHFDRRSGAQIWYRYLSADYRAKIHLNVPEGSSPGGAWPNRDRSSPSLLGSGTRRCCPDRAAAATRNDDGDASRRGPQGFERPTVIPIARAKRMRMMLTPSRSAAWMCQEMRDLPVFLKLHDAKKRGTLLPSLY